MARTLKAGLVLLVIAGAIGVVLRWREPRRTADGVAAPSATSPTRGGELVASMRAEPRAYNRYVDPTAQTEVLDFLTGSRLVRVNRATDEVEPWLAESWRQSPDGLTYTLNLRKGVAFSDGVPFTSADVLFSFRALYDPRVKSALASAMMPGGKPLQVTAPDLSTVVIVMPVPFAPGLRLLDSVPILPRHKLETALDAGRFADAWIPTRPLSEIAGLGPFVLTEHSAGQRMAFARNPYYWRRDSGGTQLPYLDTLTVLIIPDQTNEALRLQAGETDLMASADLRPEDLAAFRRLRDEGRVRLIDVGTGLDPNMLWFNLSPPGVGSPRPSWLAKKEFRQAISYAADRSAIANSVYLGAAVPLYGLVSPGNRTWYSPSITYEHDIAKARQLLASIGLTDRNRDGLLEDASGAAVRFSVLTQKGHTIRERTMAVLQEQLRQAGVTIDIVTLDPGSIFQRWQRREYDAIYFAGQASGTDPAMNSDLWLSSGSYHFWNPDQRTPATDWERRIDELMGQQASAPQLADRQRLFAKVQRILEDQLPAICFVAPRVTLAVSTRVNNPTPAPRLPQLLWSADTLASVPPRR